MTRSFTDILSDAKAKRIQREREIEHDRREDILRLVREVVGQDIANGRFGENGAGGLSLRAGNWQLSPCTSDVGRGLHVSLLCEECGCTIYQGVAFEPDDLGQIAQEAEVKSTGFARDLCRVCAAKIREDE